MIASFPPITRTRKRLYAVNEQKEAITVKLALRHSAYCFAEQHSLYGIKLKPNFFSPHINSIYGYKRILVQG